MHPSWLESHPELKETLLSLSQNKVDSWLSDIQGFADFIQADFPPAKEIIAFSQLAKLAPVASPQIDERFFRSGIKERKWLQIKTFDRCLPWHHLPLIEWCSGKGFLAQLYAFKHQQPIECVEYDHKLCQSGKLHADKFKLESQFHHCNVLTESTDAYFASPKIAVGLHACGQLHLNLLKQTVKHQSPYLALAPCCYHLLDDDRYQPLSKLGQMSELILTREEMRLALEEPVTGTTRELRQTHTMNIRRLALDEYCKDRNKNNHYTSIPSISKSWANKPFVECIAQLAKQKAIKLEKNTDWTYWQQRGALRFHHYQRYSLMRYLFRRLIEIWLVLDRALYLEQNGYRVELGEFCDKQITPRNIMILATNQRSPLNA